MAKNPLQKAKDKITDIVSDGGGGLNPQGIIKGPPKQNNNSSDSGDTPSTPINTGPKYKPLDSYVYMSKDTPSWQKKSAPMADQGIYKAPTGVSTEQSAADAKMSTALNRRFDILRGKTEQESNQQLQMANDSLSRNAAAHGRLGSGSLQRQGLLQQGQIDKQKQSALSDVEAQRETGQAALDQAAQQRAFQTSERQGAQAFASGERAAGQTFAHGERLGGQDFQQAEMDRQAKFKDFANSEQRKEFNAQMGLEMQKYNLDEIVSQFNMDMANKMWNKKDMSEWFANMHGYDPRTGVQSNPFHTMLNPDKG